MSKPRQRYIIELTETKSVKIEMLANSLEEAEEKFRTAYDDGAYEDILRYDRDEKTKFKKIRRNDNIDVDFEYDEHNFWDED